MSAVEELVCAAAEDETLPGVTDAELFIALIDLTWALVVRRRHSFRAVAMALLCEGPSDTAWRRMRYRTDWFTVDVIRAGGARLQRLLAPASQV